jgi:hypothetical protein
MRFILAFLTFLPLLCSCNMMLNVTNFNHEFWWDEPPEGLYEIDVGLHNLENPGHLMTFADLNSDKYSDVITASDHPAANGRASFTIHFFDVKT